MDWLELRLRVLSGTDAVVGMLADGAAGEACVTPSGPAVRHSKAGVPSLFPSLP